MPTNTKMDSGPIKQYLNQFGDLPTDVLLGRLVVFTITDHGVPTQDVYDSITRLNLNAVPMPQANKYIDAFKKATSDVKDSYAMAKGRTGHLLCREVTTTPDFIRRQITREVRDGGKKRLSYDPAIEATFYKPTDANDQSTSRVAIKVNNHILESDEVPLVTAIADMISLNYQRYYDTFDSMKIRAYVRGYLKKLNAVEIKGGLYFVPVSRDAELARLAEFVGDMGGGCHMDMIPMVNIERSREFITRVFEREASQSLKEITKEVDDLLSSRKGVTSAAYSKIKSRYDEVLSNANEHMENLQITQDLTAANAEVAFDSLTRLVDAMLEDSK